MISPCISYLELQNRINTQRFKYLEFSGIGIMTVLTDETSTGIITVWHTSTTEVKLWIANQ